MRLLYLLFFLLSPWIYAQEPYVSPKGAVFELTWSQPGAFAALDQESLKSLFIPAFRSTYRLHGAFDSWTDGEVDHYLADYFDTAIAPRLKDPSPSLRFVSVTAEGKLVGFALFEKTGQEEIYVGELAIDPEHWRQGLGRFLMEAILEKEPETKKIWLITENVNRGAQRFYESLGFQPSSQIHEGYSSDLYRGYEKSVISP